MCVRRWGPHFKVGPTPAPNLPTLQPQVKAPPWSPTLSPITPHTHPLTGPGPTPSHTSAHRSRCQALSALRTCARAPHTLPTLSLTNPGASQAPALSGPCQQEGPVSASGRRSQAQGLPVTLRLACYCRGTAAPHHPEFRYRAQVVGFGDGSFVNQKLVEVCLSWFGLRGAKGGRKGCREGPIKGQPQPLGGEVEHQCL